MSLDGRELIRLRVFEEELQTLLLFNKHPTIREWLEKEILKLKEKLKNG
tara:strand:+ start:329 stop:475 length:147 start_codon:yes stop_codon:yes gene_type:complete